MAMLALVTSLASVAPAQARVASVDSGSDAISARALVEFRAGSIEPRFEEHGGEELEVYEVPDGTTFTFARPVAGGPAVSGSLIGGGYGGQGLYITLNSTDQAAIAAGGGYAVGAAICAIPAVGQAACVAVGAVIAAATVYISENGVCGSGRELRIYLQLLGYPECQ
ncbi:hypothetical protein ACMA46_15440 [Clavibacter sp. Sh2141]|uniref:hypothetical protein n=1 Tax=Clavibacter sp. Sh2141 TaxID=3395374 RepID=UPI0039BD3FFE